MKITKIFKTITTIALLPVLAFIISAGGGKDGGGSKKGPDLSPGKDPQLALTNESNLVLYSNLPTPSGRQTNYSVPGFPSLWQGDVSATSLYDNPTSKYYCLVTVVNASGYKKSYVWKSSNNGNSMKIQIPAEGQSQVRVEYYEKCGPFWTDGTYGRGKWYSEITTPYLGTISMTQWVFILKEIC
jgi:hypothetical protein